MDSENNVLIVLTNKDFQDDEYNIPYRILSENGIGTKIAAAEADDCEGIHGTTVSPDYTFDEINIDSYDGILFVGGTGVERYFANDLVLSLVKDFFGQGKVVAAICWAPVIFARAGILDNKRATAWSGAKEELEGAGAIFTGEPVTVDGNIITASGPDAAKAFGEQIVAQIIG